MNKIIRYISGFFIALTTSFTTGGCGLVQSYDSSPYTHIFREESAHLTDDASSPYLDFSIDYSCLNEKDDSIAQLINRTIQLELLGNNYATLIPQAAVDSFKNDYIRNYLHDTGALYRTDIEQNKTTEGIPQWYNQTYSMVTFVEEGRGGMVNVSANIFVDTGGAHPNQWSRWMNFDFLSGKLLAKEDIFHKSAQADIEHILFEHLVHLLANRYPNETIRTLEDLQKKGFLQLSGIYIPDNFLLRKEEILFLFNRYDIAPYSEGEIVIKVPYEVIGPYLKL